ncbi:MAG: transcriptional regulator, MarR family [Hyphomicrobiales bacterium]|nr:transcriptional regulator, MarR family [Hyphomicrobiales bacterium]
MRELRRELVFQLIETSRLLQTYVDHRAKEHGSTRAQWGVLGRLRRQEGLTQVDLAGQLELQPISLVRLLDRLVEQGYLERRSDAQDRRVKRLYLTARGRQVVAELDPLGDEIRHSVLEGFSIEAMQDVRNMLVTIKDRIKHLASDAEHATTPAPTLPELTPAGDAPLSHHRTIQRQRS